MADSSYNRSYSSSPYIRKGQKVSKSPLSKMGVTLWIIGINIVCYIIGLVIYYVFGGDFFNTNLALIPQNIIDGRNLWTLITHMFMHSPTFIFHIVANMLSLIFLGTFLEKIIGKKKYLGIYLISGICGALITVLAFVLFGAMPGGIIGTILGSNLNAAGVGASAAIFGLAGVLFWITPKIKVYIFLIPIAMPLWIAILILLFGFWILSLLFGFPIGNLAHLGGFLGGFVFGLYLRSKNKRKIEVLNRYLQ